jgi:signal transduction histidine kinase
MVMRDQIQRLFSRLRKSASFFFFWFLEPRSSDEDVARREFILNVLLTGALFVSLVALVMNSIDAVLEEGPYQGVSPHILFVIFSIFLFLFSLSRRGFIRTASVALTSLYLVPVLAAVLLWGIDLPQAIAMYAFLIVMTSVLFGTRFSMIFTVLLSLFLFTVSFLHHEGIVVPNSYWRLSTFDYIDAAVMIATFGLFSLVSWLSSREIEKSLFRARASERALKEERDQLEIKVEERTRELRLSQMEQLSQLHRFAEFGRLASGLFHDLSSPLTALSINLHMLNKDDAGTHLQSALKSSDRLQEFLASVKRQLQAQDTKSTFAVREEVKRIEEMVAYRLRRANITLELNLSDMEIYASKSKFDQIIMNLLSNAIDACAEKGGREGKISLTLRERHGNVVIEVTDNGVGMSAESKTKVFKPFFTTKTVEHGMGIGLSTCQNIIEKDFKGEITFETEEGKGTTFTVKFPHYVTEGKD